MATPTKNKFIEAVKDHDLQEIVDALIEQHCFSPVVDAIVENLTIKLSKLHQIETLMENILSKKD